MIVRRFSAFALVCGLALTGASAAHAQMFGNMAQGAAQGAMQNALGQTGTTTGTGLSGLTSTQGVLSSLGVPSLSSLSAGNTTGILSYCVQNNLVSGSGAASTLSSLTSKSGITSDSSYTAGQQGLIQGANGNQVSLSSLKQGVRQKVCQSVLNQSKSLL
ncbi:hypothetical protein AOE01nite_08070 [Acetobacter oeni]|uniref:DUF2501 domain-containing protein n=2 Tax=Acetobacter oeni TaxID=304077 RepID=A0A511XI07_9PROT|nr:DUF2501 domain-containing protein [Acetobacter oeni]GBR11703.1 hypothetical protein AA21952_3435 [Acetobacter oeni LMG 21952]GEN62583.1 hypothetical protein AOE01nite_08070 [Acetobacter oeni]